MKDWIRKHILKVPGIRRLDQYLSEVPVLNHIHRGVHWALASETGRADLRVHDWVVSNLEFVRRHNLVEFCFSTEGAFIRAADGLEYWYDVRHPAGMLYDVCWGGTMDPVEIKMILRNIKPGSVVLDVGAGIGEYSLNVASKIEGTNVYAFEPTRETWQSLLKNVARNGLEHSIHCHQLALADVSGRIGLTSTHNGNHILRQVGYLSQEERPHEVVEVSTVDAFINNNGIARVDFIKADIEGAELFLLRGAVECLHLHKPHIQLEIDRRWTQRMGYSYLEVFKYLRNLGYQHVYVSNEDGSVRRPAQGQDIAEQLEKGYNFFFYHESKPFVLTGAGS